MNWELIDDIIFGCRTFLRDCVLEKEECIPVYLELFLKSKKVVAVSGNHKFICICNYYLLIPHVKSEKAGLNCNSQYLI